MRAARDQPDCLAGAKAGDVSAIVSLYGLRQCGADLPGAAEQPLRNMDGLFSYGIFEKFSKNQVVYHGGRIVYIHGLSFRCL